MKHSYVLAIALLATGCTSATEFSGPSGERMVSVSCDGLAQNVGDCLRRISDECPRGYSIVGANSTTTPIMTGGNSFALNGYGNGGGGGGFSGGGYIGRNVIAACK